MSTKKPPLRPPVGNMSLNTQELPDIRPSMGYTKRIAVDHIVNDPKNSHLMFKVVNNENGQMQAALRDNWKVYMEEHMVNFDFDPDDEDMEEQVNRTKKGPARYPVGIAKSGQPVDAYLLYCSRSSYEKALAEREKVAKDQVELVYNGQILEAKKDALEKALGGEGRTIANVTESNFTNTIAST